MTTYTCRKCEATGLGADAMLMRKGKPSQVCRECWSATRNGGGSVKAKAQPVGVAGESYGLQPAKLGLSLEIARGYGFRASAEDGVLVIEQDTDSGETATVVFSRTEFKVLAAQFAPWCES